MLENCDPNVKRAIIDNKTLIPITLVITIAAGVWFIASLNAQVQANDNKINKMEETIVKIADIQNQLTGINIKITNIEMVLNKK